MFVGYTLISHIFGFLWACAYFCEFFWRDLKQLQIYLGTKRTWRHSTQENGTGDGLLPLPTWSKPLETSPGQISVPTCTAGPAWSPDPLEMLIGWRSSRGKGWWGDKPELLNQRFEKW